MGILNLIHSRTGHIQYIHKSAGAVRGLLTACSIRVAVLHILTLSPGPPSFNQ